MLTSDYTGFHAFIGGVCIGLASFIAALASGKIPGISGMLGRFIHARRGDTAWRGAFLAGLIAGAAAAFAFVTPASSFYSHASLPLLAIAGLLVGFGTRLGGGCTSGHGVCGVGLGSKSSIAATVVFMLSAMLVVFVMHHTAFGGVAS